MLLVGQQASAFTKLSGGCWCGYLSGVRFRFAYGPAAASATHCLFRLASPFWYQLTRVVWDKGPLSGIVVVILYERCLGVY